MDDDLYVLLNIQYVSETRSEQGRSGRWAVLRCAKRDTSKLSFAQIKHAKGAVNLRSSSSSIVALGSLLLRSSHRNVFPPTEKIGE